MKYTIPQHVITLILNLMKYTIPQHVITLSAMLSIGGLSPLLAGPLFPDNLANAKWVSFDATGYTKPVTGIIYRGKPQPVTGMPLGVLDTGFIDIAPNGTLGFSTIFNDMAPRGGPIESPFLGLSVGGRTWVLASDESGVAQKNAIVPILPMDGGIGELVDRTEPGELLVFEDPDWMQMGSAWTNRKDGLAAVFKANTSKFVLNEGDVGGCTETTPEGVPNNQTTWIAWRAPKDMEIKIDGGVWSNHLGRPCAFVIRKNGKDIHGGFPEGAGDGSLIDPGATSVDQQVFSLSGIKVGAGDIITFNFHSKGDPAYPNFGTIFGISAKISSKESQWDLTQDFNLANGNPNLPWSFGSGRLDGAQEQALVKMDGVSYAGSIDYWGHYPVLDMQYATDAPVRASLRAWAPFIPRDIKAMNTPGAVFEVHLKNTTAETQQGALAFSMPGFKSHQSKNRAIGFPNIAIEPDLPAPKVTRAKLTGANAGVIVKDEAWNVSYALAAIGVENPRTGGALGLESSNWKALETSLPKLAEVDDGGSTVAVDFSLKPGEEKVIRFVLGWYSPVWNGNGTPGTSAARLFANTGATYTHMYASRYKDAADVVNYLSDNHASLLKRILAWQEVLYTAPEVPNWLAESLINNLMYLARCSAWAQAKPPVGEWCKPEDGIFAMNESPRGCPQMSCLPCDTISGMLPLIYFAPECALSTLRTWKAYQLPSGDFPFSFGVYYDVTSPQGASYQQVMNGANYVIIIDRYWKAMEKDPAVLKEFYDSVKRATDFSFNTRPKYGLSQIVAMPEPTSPATKLEWFEDRHWYGYVAHPGGMRMAQAEMTRQWAEAMGDTEFVAKLDAWLKAGAEALEEHLWNGEYYDAFNEPESGRRESAFFSPMINGQYFAKSAGLPGVFPQDRFDGVMKMMRKACAATITGMPPTMINGDGTLFQERGDNAALGAGYLTGKWGYTNAQVRTIAMAFMYADQKEFGLELMKKNLELNSLKWGYTWDGPHAASQKADNGERSYGTDYYQNQILWGAPAALAGQDISGPLKPGGLADRMIKAGNEKP